MDTSEIVKALELLGFNQEDPAGKPGALEAICMALVGGDPREQLSILDALQGVRWELAGIRSALARIADALEVAARMPK